MAKKFVPKEAVRKPKGAVKKPGRLKPPAMNPYAGVKTASGRAPKF